MKRVKRRKVWIPIYYAEKFLETMGTFDEVNDLHVIEYFHERWILIGFTFINTPKEYAYYMPGTILKMYPERRIDDNHFNEQFYFHQGLSDIYESYLESKGAF